MSIREGVGSGSCIHPRIHHRFQGAPLVVLAVLTVLLSCVAGCGDGAPAPATSGITARELVETGALVGPGPSILGWSPRGAQLAYTAPPDGRDGADVLWVYDASSGEREVLLDPSAQPDDIDVSSAQWSPRGDAMLLSGDTSLWVLTTASGELKALAGGGGGHRRG
jgi:hypothetical protein